MRCEIFIREMWHYMSKTIELMKELNFLVRALNKPGIRPRKEISGVCKNNYNKIDRLLLHNIDVRNCVIWKWVLFYFKKKNAPLKTNLGQMHTDSDEYPPYSGRIYEIFENC